MSRIRHRNSSKCFVNRCLNVIIQQPTLAKPQRGQGYGEFKRNLAWNSPSSILTVKAHVTDEMVMELMPPGKPFIGGADVRARGDFMRIEQHDIVELEDGSSWQIWPGDIATTLEWLPTTELQILAIDDELCSHALIDQEGGSRVRVIAASAEWPLAEVRQSLLKVG
jgi:hypothetical protein